MGLDMYAYRVRPDERPLPDVDAKFTRDSNVRSDEDGTPLFHLVDDDFHYWRKHPDLHGWMEQLYRRKGGTDPQFDCNSVRLTIEDLDELEKAVIAGKLPHTSGFFFGESRVRNRAGDLEFIHRARDAIRGGDAIYYDSWW
jgi:hypothetical protein